MAIKQKIIFTLVILAITQGCSTKKNTFLSRSYHNLTSKYNGYFNANEMVKEAVAGITSEHKEDYEKLLPLFIYGDEQQARGVYPIMDEAIKKSSIVIDRHSMVFKNKEYCKWIDDNYLLIGRASFYKQDFKRAIEIFNYVTRTYKDDPIRFEALLWQARTNGELKKFNKANVLMAQAVNDKDFPEKLKLEAKLIDADIKLKQNKYSDAVIALETALPLVKKRKTKARITFILAQIYQERKDAEKAIRAYNRVLKLKPGYEMEFYANINQALAFNNKINSDAIKAKLNKMLKDDKNKEFFDQIYYALAEIELKERHRDLGMDLLQKSSLVSVNNNKQKAKSFLRLADLHFEDRSYGNAQQYYDSTSSLIDKEHERFESVINRKESLTQLVTNLTTIQVQDSLQRIAAMNEDERNMFVDSLLIVDLEREEEKIRSAEIALLDLNSGTTKTIGINTGGWYFYNINAMNFGKQEFTKRWGKRKLEDHWRRSNKSSNAMAIGNGTITNNDPQLGSRDSYLKNLPLTQAKIDSSNNLIDIALYANGILYKEKLNDIPNSIESFEELTARFKQSKNLVTAYYQLYRLYLQKENSSGNSFVSFDVQSSSSYYKDKILLEFPDSEFAELIRNPNYKKAEDVEAERQLQDYENTFDLYTKKIYNEVLIRANAILNNEPTNPYIPKYYLLKANILAVIDDKQGYELALTTLAENHASTDEGKLAIDLLERMKTYTPDQPKGPITIRDEGPFTIADSDEHYFILLFPNEKNLGNKLKNSIINFNDRYFRNESIKIAESFIDNDNQLIILRSFPNKDKGLNYYRSFVTNTDVLSMVNKTNKYKKFLITTKNFAELFRNKNITEYEKFFDKNYIN